MRKVVCPHCHRTRNVRKDGSQCPCGWVKSTLRERLSKAIAGWNGKEYTPRVKPDKKQLTLDSVMVKVEVGSPTTSEYPLSALMDNKDYCNNTFTEPTPDMVEAKFKEVVGNL
jgi:hypothetical protein